MYPRILSTRTLLASLLCLAVSPLVVAKEPQKQVIGWLEEVRVNEANMVFRAKIDTGADSSSINTRVLKPFSRKGQTWVRFQLTNWQGNTIVLERKVERFVRIKRKLALPIKRPVVKLGICLAGVEHIGDVSLADRKNFKYQMLIGRSYLTGHFVIDPEKTYLTRPVCKPQLQEIDGGEMP